MGGDDEASFERQMQAACGFAMEAGRAQARAKRKDRMMEIANARLRNELRAARAELAAFKGPSGPWTQLKHLGKKLFAERQARAAADAAVRAEVEGLILWASVEHAARKLAEARLRELEGLMAPDNSGRALAVTLEYTARLLDEGGEALLADFMRTRADKVRDLAAGTRPPSEEKPVPDVPCCADGVTTGAGEVFVLATDPEKTERPHVSTA